MGVFYASRLPDAAARGFADGDTRTTAVVIGVENEAALQVDRRLRRNRGGWYQGRVQGNFHLNHSARSRVLPYIRCNCERGNFPHGHGWRELLVTELTE